MDIKTVIKDKGFTMDSLAKKMKRSKSSISQVANGNPTIDKIKDIANGLGCHWLEFFADELQKEGIEVKRADGTNLLSSNPRPVGAGIFRCPNCGCGVVMEIKMVQPPVASSQASEVSPEQSDTSASSDELPFKDEA